MADAGATMGEAADNYLFVRAPRAPGRDVPGPPPPRPAVGVALVLQTELVRRQLRSRAKRVAGFGAGGGDGGVTSTDVPLSAKHQDHGLLRGALGQMWGSEGAPGGRGQLRADAVTAARRGVRTGSGPAPQVGPGTRASCPAGGCRWHLFVSPCPSRQPAEIGGDCACWLQRCHPHPPRIRICQNWAAASLNPIFSGTFAQSALRGDRGLPGLLQPFHGAPFTGH